MEMHHYMGWCPRIQLYFKEIMELINNTYCIQNINKLDFYIKVKDTIYIIKYLEFNDLKEITNNIKGYSKDVEKIKENLKKKREANKKTIFKTMYLINEISEITNIFKYDKDSDSAIDFTNTSKEFLKYFKNSTEIDYCLFFRENKTDERISMTYSLLSHSSKLLNKMEDALSRFNVFYNFGFDLNEYGRMREKWLIPIWIEDFYYDHPKHGTIRVDYFF